MNAPIPPPLTATGLALVADRMQAEARQRFDSFLLIAAYATFIGTACQALVGGPLQLVLSDLAIGLVFLWLRRWALRVPGVGRLQLATHFIAGGGLVFILWHGLVTGQNSSLSVWFIAAIPILAAFLGGPRAAIGWTLACTLALVGIWASEFYWSIPPLFERTSAMTMQTRVILTLLAAAFGIAARLASDRHIRALAESLAAEQEAKRAADEARQVAENANRAKSAFLATMSHEIRTPLNGIIGFNSLLLDMPVGERERHYLELARQSGEVLLHLVNDFLDFSKIEAGELRLEQLPFAPRRELEETLALVRESAQRKELELRAEISAPPELLGDAGRLRQILLNLLGNAVKFTASGQVLLRCHPLPATGPACWLRIEVSDTGIGIDAATLRQLFQPFTQADASTTRRYGGTGLGLAICKSLAELMGGRIGVESRVGEGSTFWVELPFLPAAPAAATAGADTAARVIDALPSTAHVLIAEDNPVNQITAAEMVKRLGYRVTVVGNGEEALQAVNAGAFDLVLMDCDMPVMDGFAASRAIRALPAPRRLPILAMTANALRGDRERCLAAGMDDYLPKPVRLADLRQALSGWLPAAVPQDRR